MGMEDAVTQSILGKFLVLERVLDERANRHLRAPPEDHYLGGWNGVVPDGHRRTYKEFLYE